MKGPLSYTNSQKLKIEIIGTPIILKVELIVKRGPPSLITQTVSQDLNHRCERIGKNLRNQKQQKQRPAPQSASSVKKNYPTVSKKNFLN